MEEEQKKEPKQPIKITSVVNPTNKDLEFVYDSATYVLKAGEKGQFTEPVSLHAARKLADVNVKTSNPEEHRVLTGAYLTNTEPEIIAKNLGINLEKIRKEAVTKENEGARVINLEAQLLGMKKQIEILTTEKELEIEKEPIIEPPTVKLSEADTEEPVKETDYSKLSWNELRQVAVNKGIFKPSMKKEDILEALK